MSVKQFIENAIKGGWHKLERPFYGTPFGKGSEGFWEDGEDAMRYEHLPPIHEILLDPKAWEAVGRALGNKDEMRCISQKCDTVQCEYAGYWDWKRKMVGLMEAIVYSDWTPEKYIESLFASAHN